VNPSKILGREPVLWLAALNAVVALAVGFGLELTTERQALIQAALTAVLALVARGQVTPVVTADENIEMVRRLAKLPPADDIPSTGSPEAGQSAVQALLIVFLILVILKVIGAL
jgi:hypothetical protein